ncbi:MAG: CDP-diacylglycerol--glycerol-3-phosphate 3-phosphatidyltransferase [Myxococcota bacterium]
MSVPLGVQARSLPNLITYVRILAVPLVMAIMQSPRPGASVTAAVVFSLAALTDAVDGYLARRLGLVSQIGKLLDPLADKLLVMGAMVMAAWLGQLSPWLVFLILAPEMYVNGLRRVAAAEGLVMAAGASGKRKTAFQMVGLVALLVNDTHPVLGVSVDFHAVGVACLVISVAFSLWSAGEYSWAFFRLVEERARKG